MSLARLQRSLARVDCDVAVDQLTRRLYATDASLYQIEPLAVAFPRGAHQAQAVVQAAVEAGVPVIPRGAGTGLVGGAIGAGLVIDFSRHNRELGQPDLERQTVRVGPGVVLDQLNAFLKPHGFCFGPDVATSSRATLGGMIANNSSGARVPIYGTTADHLVSLEVLLADGRIAHVGSGLTGLDPERVRLGALVQQSATAIRERMPATLLKRWAGYGVDRFLKDPADLGALICGSEGTLACILSAELRIVPVPREKALALIFFESVAAAMEATVSLLDLKPAAIEHMDRVLFDQTKGQRQFQAARDLLQLDTLPSESILLVEFYEDTAERLHRLAERRLGLRRLTLRAPSEMNLVWALRKAGLSLLTSRQGPAKPITCVEDTAVRPDQLPEYVRGLESILKPLDVEVCYYGHAAAGLLHVRPVLNLREASDRDKLRQIADQVSALVRQFDGSLAGEHGVGMARTEYLPAHLGPELTELMGAIKETFDPQHRFNPGKIVGDGRFRIDQDLRPSLAQAPALPFTPVLAFAGRDGSFLANLDQCNGCGGCRKDTAVMCPTFTATGDESMSTRGRANALRAALELAESGRGSRELHQQVERVLSSCLGCKACTVECPSNVNLTLLKAEWMHAAHRQQGAPLGRRFFAAIDQVSALASFAPHLANAALASRLVRRLLARMLGLAPARPLPAFAAQRFDHWFRLHPRPSTAPRGEVLLWDDTFVRHHEPHIGMAAVRVLEAAGYAVRLLTGRQCCGRPAFSQGMLDRAAQLGRDNVVRLNQQAPGETPLVFLEPSCYSMFKQDYQELRIPGAEKAATRALLFEDFVEDLLSRIPNALAFNPSPRSIGVHVHCHARALAHPTGMVRLIQRLPGVSAQLLQTGCCGMAGAFGVLETNLALSKQVAAPLLEAIQRLPAGSTVVASGTSCRHQIQDGATVRPLHAAELLAAALAEGR